MKLITHKISSNVNFNVREALYTKMVSKKIIIKDPLNVYIRMTEFNYDYNGNV